MKNRKMKKGFTLVELVVVIAVIGILAGVSVATYFGVTNSAKKSNDISLTKQLNTALDTDEIINGKPKSLTDALKVVEANGFSVEKMTPTSTGFSYVWDKAENQFLLLDKEYNIVAPEEAKDLSTRDTFGFANTNAEIATLSEKGYGAYLTTKYTETLPEITKSLDTGLNTIDFTFKTEESSTTDDPFILYSNGGNITVDASNATIEHYGSANKTEIKAVAGNSYHEFGSSALIDITAGRLVAEAKSEIKGIYINANAVKVDVKTGAIVDKVAQPSGVTGTVTGATAVEVEKDKFEESVLLFAGGNGTKESPYLINSDEQFGNITKVASDAKDYFKLLKNVDLLNVSAFSEKYYVTTNNASLDLNGFEISNLDRTLVQSAGDFEISNGTFNYLDGGTIVRDSTQNDSVYKFDKLTLKGDIEVSGYHYGPLASYIGNTDNGIQKASVYASNIVSELNIEATTSAIGGLFGYSANTFMNIENSSVYGTIISGDSVGGFLNGSSSHSAGANNKNGKGLGKITNNKFNGAIYVPTGKKAFYFGPNYKDDATVAGDNATLNPNISINNDIVNIPTNFGEKITIKHTNKDITFYKVIYSFNVNYADGRAGGYPRTISKVIKANETSDSIDTGLFKYKIAETNKTEGTLVEGSEYIFIKGEDKTYYYDGEGVFTIDESKMVSISIYGYSADRLVVKGTNSYSGK